jgi:hypothetical protein
MGRRSGSNEERMLRGKPHVTKDRRDPGRVSDEGDQWTTAFTAAAPYHLDPVHATKELRPGQIPHR